MLRAYLAMVDDRLKSISVVASLEVRSALSRRLRLSEIVPDAFAIAVKDLQEVCDRVPRIAIDGLVVDLAGQLIARRTLRSLDALQLSSALLLRAELEPAHRLLFIASDHRLLTAAAAEGLPTWNPEDTAAPPPQTN